ncbi:MAG TPA: tetratricopeptide repeat protein [Chthonomonadaceae bacterium]|nr:tetratricopeptide repeat protein [Chthonomonadaceae bacterium]
MMLTICLWALGIEIVVLGPIVYSSHLLRRGRNTEALPWLRYGYAVSRVIPSLRGPAALHLCACHTQLGNYDQAFPFNEEALQRLSRRGESSRNLAIARAYRGILLARMGQFTEAESIFTAILADNQLSARLRIEVEACAAAGYINQGRFAEAKRLLTGVIEATRPNTISHALAESNMSVCHFFEGDLPEAVKMARRAASRTVNWHWITTLALANCLNSLIELGDLDAAREIEVQIMPRMSEAPNYVQSAILSMVARLTLRQGDLDRARDLAERAYPLDPNPNAQARALLVQAEVFANRQNAGRTEALCEEILRLNALDYYKERAAKLVRGLKDKLPLYTSPPQAETQVQQVRIQ